MLAGRASNMPWLGELATRNWFTALHKGLDIECRVVAFTIICPYGHGRVEGRRHLLLLQKGSNLHDWFEIGGDGLQTRSFTFMMIGRVVLRLTKSDFREPLTSGVMKW
ncbi:hypothetical protein D1007_22687 [Hordeum vulgare]|nr:hypothetical protein D1007_22687 [Hordeum vulgare]